MSYDNVIIVDNRLVEEFVEEYIEDAADGYYGRLRHDHLKENEPSYYNMLVAEGRLKRECANAQLWIDRYVEKAIDRVKRSDEYLDAQKRGDFMKTVSLLETEDATAKSFAIRLYVYGTYSD
jgi:hypothetical protein